MNAIRLPVKEAARIVLNVNDLVTIHRLMCDGVRRHLERNPAKPANLDPGVWLLLQWIERSALATGDLPCEIAGSLINQRELLEMVNNRRREEA